MSFTFRRVVTGHDAHGQAIVRMDEAIASEPRGPGYSAKVVWCTSEFPPKNNDEDFTNGVPGPRGTRVLFRTAEFIPGQSKGPGMHRTETQDVAIVISGELEMRLDSGEVVDNFGPGDIIVQRGTMHDWVPKGSEPVRVLFILMDSEPILVGDGVLNEDISAFNGLFSPMPPDAETPLLQRRD